MQRTIARLAATLLLVAANQALGQASFTPIPDLPGGTNLSRARAISSDGTVAVGISNSTNGDEAMRWLVAAPASGGLGDLAGGAFASEAHACSHDGSIVFGAGTNASGNNEAFRWTAAGGMVSLGFLPSGGYVSRAYASNFDGTTACGENLFQPTGVPPPLPITQAFRWTQSGGMQALGFLPGSTYQYSTARAMSLDGSVIVGWAGESNFGNRPFRWTAATGMMRFTGIYGNARGVSPSGEWIVGSDSDTLQAFRWSEHSGIRELGVIDGRTSSIAVAVTNDGRRVLAVCNGGPGQAVCVCELSACWSYWTTLADVLSVNGVSTAGWTLSVAQSMSADGTVIAGYGVNPSGQTQGWVARIPPLPPLPGCANADFNCDGDVGTDADIADFFRCLAGSCPLPPCCASSDYNDDGDFGTDADIEAYFRVLAGSC